MLELKRVRFIRLILVILISISLFSRADENTFVVKSNLTTSSDSQPDELDKLSQKAKKALLNFGKSEAGKLLSFVTTSQQYVAHGVISKTLAFTKKNERNEEETWVVIGHTDSSVYVYKTQSTDPHNKYYLAPYVNNTERCISSKGNDESACKVVSNTFFIYSAENFFGDTSKRYEVSALAYVRNEDSPESEGILYIGFGRTMVITKRGTTDFNSMSFTYGSKKVKEGGLIASIPFEASMKGEPQFQIVNKIATDYGVRNIFTLYRAEKGSDSDQPTPTPTVVAEFIAEFNNSDNMSAGFSIKNVAGIPIPFPSKGTFNVIRNAIKPNANKTEVKSKYMMLDSDHEFKEINSVDKNNTHPTYTLPAAERGIFLGYGNGALSLINRASKSALAVTNSPLAIGGKNIKLNKAISFEAYNPASDLLLVSDNEQILLIKFAGEHIDQIVNVSDKINLKDTFGEGVYPSIYYNYGSDLLVMMNNGLLVSFGYNEDLKEPFVLNRDSAINRYCYETTSDGQCDVTLQSMLNEPYSMAIDESGKYLAISTKSTDVKKDYYYYSKIFLIKFDKAGLKGNIDKVSAPKLEVQSRDYEKERHTSRSLLFNNYFPDYNESLQTLRAQQYPKINFGLAGNLQFYYDEDSNEPKELTYTIVRDKAPPLALAYQGGAYAIRWGAVGSIKIADGVFSDSVDQLLQGMSRCINPGNDDWYSRNFCFYTRRYYQGPVRNLEGGR